jgi:hypothetical protein
MNTNSCVWVLYFGTKKDPEAYVRNNGKIGGQKHAI